MAIEVQFTMECPFCGSDSQIRKVTKNKGSNRTGNIPEGAELVRTIDQKSIYHPSKTVYYWERKGYIIKCSNEDCIGHSIGRVFASEEEAIEVWNRRIRMYPENEPKESNSEVDEFVEWYNKQEEERKERLTSGDYNSSPVLEGRGGFFN